MMMILYRQTTAREPDSAPRSGLIHLPLPSPVLNSKCPAAVEYDARLHVDTQTASVDGRSDNMLSISARFATPSNWVLLELAGNEHMLLYKSVAEAWPQMRNARRRQDIFPFPPESVAHMVHIFSELQCVSRRWAHELAAVRAAGSAAPLASAHERADPSCVFRYHNDLLPAMLLLGASAGHEQVAHELYALTLCSVQDGRELPCMTWEHGLIFTAQVVRDRVVLLPTVPTHEWPHVESMANGDVRPFSELPLPEGSSVCVSEFYELLKHGIVLLDRSVAVDLNPKKTPGARSLACTLCPVVHWPVLLLLAASAWTVPGRVKLTLQESAHVFEQHTTSHSSLVVTADTLQRERPELAAFAAAERIECEMLLSAVERCLALQHVAALVFVQADALIVWSRDVDGSLVLLGSAAEFCFSASHPQPQNLVQFIASHPEHGLCSVEVLEDGRHAARYWRIWPRTLLVELRDEAARRLSEHMARLHTGMDACAQEMFNSTRESLSENVVDAEKNLAEASAAGRRTYVHQTIFDLSSRTPVFAPVADVDVAPEGAVWGLVLERESKFLHKGCYSVSVIDTIRGGAMLFDMDFATMSRAMLQEGTEVWISLSSSVYLRIIHEAQAQGSKVMLPVSPELHERMQTDSPVSRQLRAFYVLGGSSNVAPIDSNTITVIVVVANKSCAPGRKSAADDDAREASRMNVSIGQNDFKMLAICLPIYAADSLPSVAYHRDPALPFYRYLKEDNTSRSRSSA